MQKLNRVQLFLLTSKGKGPTAAAHGALQRSVSKADPLVATPKRGRR